MFERSAFIPGIFAYLSQKSKVFSVFPYNRQVENEDFLECMNLGDSEVKTEEISENLRFKQKRALVVSKGF